MKTIILNNKHKELIKTISIMSKHNYSYSRINDNKASITDFKKKYIIHPSIYELASSTLDKLDNNELYKTQDQPES